MANRVVLGEFGGDYVLRVSRPGFNVLDPALPRHQLAFDSRWPENLNIASRGTFAFNSGNVFDVSHGMSYATGPVVLAWVEVAGYIYNLATTRALVAASGELHSYEMIVTPTLVRFGYQGLTGRPNATVSYYILRNSNG